MKVLLIFPSSTIYGDDPSLPPVVQPLGVAYLASYLEREGHQVSILDCRGNKSDQIKVVNGIRYGITDDQILSAVEKFKPDIVGISNMWTAYSGDAHEAAQVIKNRYPEMMIIFGGSHPSEFAELVLKDKNVDLVVLGEGEMTLTEVLKNLEQKLPLENIQGIAYRAGDEVIKTTPRERMGDIDNLPFPARHLLPMERYLNQNAKGNYLMRNPGMGMLSSRGCPQKCVFCTVRAVWGRDWEGRSPENVVDEIQLLQDKYGVREISFLDDDLSRDMPRLGAICDEIIRRKVDIRWTTPNGVAHWLLDEPLLDKMKASGCYRLTFGIESGCKETRKFIKKQVPLEQATRMIEYSNKIGLWTICTFILGFPYETKENMYESIQYAIDCGTDMGVFYLLMPHPTSDVYKTFKEEGLLDLDPIMDPTTYKETEDFAKIGEVLSQRGAQTKFCSPEELQEIMDDAYKLFFSARVKSWLTNPLHIARKIRSIEDFRYTLKLGKGFAKPIRSFINGKKNHINMLWEKMSETEGSVKLKLHKSKSNS